jgi:hypothetical protein
LVFIEVKGVASVIYEIRIYEAVDGKAEAMKTRFKTEAATRFPAHGIELLGVFESDTETSRLTYLTRFKSEGDRSKAWAAFGADPDWRAVKAATEIDGPLLKNQTVSVLSPTVAGLLLG